MLLTLDIDDGLYQQLSQKVGQDNLNQFIQDVLRPQLLITHPPKKAQTISDLLGADGWVDDDCLVFDKLDVGVSPATFE